MGMRFPAAVALTCICATMAFTQGKAKAPNQQLILEQILTQIYQPSEVGKHAMGVGGDTDVRRPGILVVVQREGLFGSLIRNETASSAIHGLEVKLYRGHQDYAVPVGERYYVTAVHVGSSTIDIGMLSARQVDTAHGMGRVWTIATFYFPEELLANAEKDAVIQEIDQWLVPEGRSGVPAAPAVNAALPAPVTAPATPARAVTAGPMATPATAATPAKNNLEPGMTRDQVLAALGKPQREVSFEATTWMHYPGMVVLLRDGKLTSIEQPGGLTTASVALRSEPSGAEIYIDGQLTGSTPSTLELPAGPHQISIRLAGYAEWTRDVRVFGGSETHFDAKLEQK